MYELTAKWPSSVVLDQVSIIFFILFDFFDRIVKLDVRRSCYATGDWVRVFGEDICEASDLILTDDDELVRAHTGAERWRLLSVEVVSRC